MALARPQNPRGRRERSLTWFGSRHMGRKVQLVEEVLCHFRYAGGCPGFEVLWGFQLVQNLHQQLKSKIRLTFSLPLWASSVVLALWAPRWGLARRSTHRTGPSCKGCTKRWPLGQHPGDQAKPVRPASQVKSVRASQVLYIASRLRQMTDMGLPCLSTAES